MTEKNSFMDQIANAGIDEEPAIDELARVTQLAQKQLELLGEGITKGPTGDAIQGLRDWAKREKVQPLESLKGFSIANLIGALVERLSEYRKLSEIDLPAAMAAVGGVGLSQFKLSNGYTVTIKEDIRAALKVNMWTLLLPWMDEHGLGDIVNDEIKFSLDRRKEQFPLTTDIATELFMVAKENKIIPADAVGMTKGEAIIAFSKVFCETAGEEKLSINAATLKAMVKERREKGVEFPQDLFSIMDFKKALVEPPKAAASKKK